MKELCGDFSKEHPLKLRQKAWYLLYNLGRGLVGYMTVQRTLFWSYIEYKDSINSPGRRYLDYFILHKLPEIIPKKNLTVLDVGCGGGYLRDMLTRAGYTGMYTGIDVVQKSWSGEDQGVAFKSTFIETKIEEYLPPITYDLVISNTALEHVADDITAVERCRALTKDAGTQVHVIPAFWSLFAYLWHGYRQYTPRRIKKLFKGQSYCVYRLGGFASLVLHVCSITIPERIIGIKTIRNTKGYYRAVFLAQKIDKWLPFCSAMYVVVVKNKD